MAFVLPQLFWRGFSDQFFEIKRIAALLLAAAICFQFPWKIKFPERVMRFVVMGLALKYLPLIFQGRIGVFWPSFTNDLAMLSVFLFFYQLTDDGRDLKSVFTLALAYFSAASILQHFFFRLNPTVGWTFGNENMLAEHLVLLVPAWLWRGGKRVETILVGLLVITALYIQEARSAMLIGVVIGGFHAGQYVHRKGKKIFYALVMGLAGVGFAFIMFINASAPKLESTSYRWELLKASTGLIKENPLGVGPGMFEFSLNPYKKESGFFARNPRFIDRGPHDEFLKWLAESGWAFGLFMLVCSVIFLRMVWKNRDTPEGQFGLHVAIVLLVQSLVQFPFDQPCSILIISVYLAIMARRMDRESSKCIPRPAMKVLGVLITLSACIMFVSRYAVSYRPHDVVLLSLSCRLDATQMRACVNAMDGLARMEQWDQILDLARIELKRRPLNHWALKHLIRALMKQGQGPWACELEQHLGRLFPSEVGLCPSQDDSGRFDLESYRNSLERD